MVPFRYHIVTLISVFLALAVGVVLGAGPLQKTINHENAASVDTETLQEELAQSSSLNAENADFIWGVADQVLPGSLEDQKISVIFLPGTQVGQGKDVLEGLQAAGGEVVSEVHLPEIWLSSDQATYRQTLAAAVSAHLGVRPEEATPEAILAQGLVEVVTSDGPTAELIAAMLTDGDTTMVQPDDLTGDPANCVVVIGPVSAENGEETQQSGELRVEHADPEPLWVGMAQAASTAPGGAVATGGADASTGFIAVLRSTSVRIATVDQSGTAMAGVNVALALADGSVGAYGQGVGASAPVAPLPTR